MLKNNDRFSPYSHQSQNRLSDLVAEHLDHMHYLNDILCLNITDLNHVLTNHLLHKLLIPLYISSLVIVSNVRQQQQQTIQQQPPPFDSQQQSVEQGSSNSSNTTTISYQLLTTAKVSYVVALFLLSQVCLIISHSPLVQTLAWIILKTDRDVLDEEGVDRLVEYYDREIVSQQKKKQQPEDFGEIAVVTAAKDTASKEQLETVQEQQQLRNNNITDEEKQRLAITPTAELSKIVVVDKPFLDTLYSALDCTENDYAALFVLSLLYAMAFNKGKGLSIYHLV